MEYKISKESVDKVSELKIDPTRYVEITDADIIGDAKITLEDFIYEAYKTALKEGIRANVIMLNKRLAKTNGFGHITFGGVMDIPPMICGLEAYVTDEIPEEFAFSMLEAPSTIREQVYGEGHKRGYAEGYDQGVKDFAEKVKNYYRHMTSKPLPATVEYYIDQIAKEMLEEEV